MQVQHSDHKGRAITTTCCYCGVGCGIVAKKGRNGVLTVEGDKNHPVNKGMLCSKGMNLHYTVMDKSDRLLYPEVRYARHLPRQRVSWDRALERAAAAFTAILEKYGPDSVAFYASGQCLTEEYYVLNKLVKGFIGTNNIDTNSRLCMSSAVVAYKKSLGEDSVPVCYDDIEETDCIFVSGGNPAWCHPIVWRRVEAAKAKNPALVIIVSDPRKTQTCMLADIHLQLNPGTDIVLHNAIARCLIEEALIDLDFIVKHTNNFTAYRESVFSVTITAAAAICGVPESAILQTAACIGNAKAFLTMWTMGLNQSAKGTDKNLSLINLNLITGQIGKPGAGPFSLTGQPNAMGGREVGGMANLLPAHRSLDNAGDRKEVEMFWNSKPISPQPGLSATEIFEALEEGKLKAIWIIGTNPLVSLPDVRKAEAALAKAKFVVVQEVSNTPETLTYADVVLPAAAWMEKEGTMTNAERRISHLNQLVDAPGEALPDAEILCRFAQKMGYPGFVYASPGDIFCEHAALTKGTSIDISGLSYAVIEQNRSVQWPYISGEMKVSKRLFADHRFYTADGRAFLHAVEDSNRSESCSQDFPLVLLTGRIRDQWHTMTKTGKVNKLKQHVGNQRLEIHPEDAAERGIEEDMLVVVQSARGEIRVKAKLVEELKPGVVFLPMHWGKILNSDLNRANNLTNNLVDPVSKEPDFKFTAVEVKKYAKKKERILVIGAGAGACGFVKSYRGQNKTDEIVVFSKENHPFYNRVLLPDYISSVLPWSNLIKITDEEEQELDITLHRGISIEKIDRENRTVTDSNGNTHVYDKLLLATGSRAARLKDIPALDGIFTMRSRQDADAFMHYIKGKQKVTIIGGGLLGIELAASLKETGLDITIIQRISRLMDRQLDPLGSQLLHEDLVEKGIEVYYNDEVERYLGGQMVTGVRLKSGITISCDALVIAIGTVPNIEIVKESGIECKRGVIVNEYLQTGDPSVFAIGEIAEFKGFLYGITAAAEQQAAIAASFMNGDISEFYSGSLLMNILKMHGSDLCSLGMVECPDEEGYEEVIFMDKAKRYYKKCIIHNDRLIGAILIGDKSEFLEFRNLIEHKMELSEKRLQLLRSGKTQEPMVGKLVCSCNNVGEGNILNKIKEGCRDHLQLCQLSGAGMGCGSCRPEVKHILENQLSHSQPKAMQEIVE